MTWSEACDLLEHLLEQSATLVDGEDAVIPDLPDLEVDGVPDDQTLARLETLLSDARDALQTLTLRRAEIQQELEHTARLRNAGTRYIRGN